MVVPTTLPVLSFTMRRASVTGIPLLSTAVRAIRPFVVGRVAIWVKVNGPTIASVVGLSVPVGSKTAQVAIPTSTSSGRSRSTMSLSALSASWRVPHVLPPSSERRATNVLPVRVNRSMMVGPFPLPSPHGREPEEDVPGPVSPPTSRRCCRCVPIGTAFTMTSGACRSVLGRTMIPTGVVLPIIFTERISSVAWKSPFAGCQRKTPLSLSPQMSLPPAMRCRALSLMVALCSDSWASPMTVKCHLLRSSVLPAPRLWPGTLIVRSEPAVALGLAPTFCKRLTALCRADCWEAVSKLL